MTEGLRAVWTALEQLAAAVKDATDKAVNDFAKRGFRVLGVAREDGHREWQLPPS